MTEINDSLDFVESLFEAIKHGDAEHQTWLKATIQNWVNTNLDIKDEETK